MGLFGFFKKSGSGEEKSKGQTEKKEISNLEKAGLIFFKHKKYVPGVFIFEKVILDDPSNANAWYGLGNCLAMVSNSLARPELLTMSIACFKSAIQANGGTHKISEEFASTIKNTLKLSEAEYDMISPAGTTEIKDLYSKLKIGYAQFVKEFSEMTEDRMILVMFLGDTGHESFFPLMKYAILEDNNIDVRYAALKRIRNYKNHPELEKVFERAIREQKGDELEPYLSMALHSISEPWAEKFKGPDYKNIFK